MARKARWLGLLATYRELPTEERDAVVRTLEQHPWARELKQRFDEQDELLASLVAPRPSPGVTERIMAATVARDVDRSRARRRPVLVGALALVLLVMVTGTGLASSKSLPGDVLYPVKRAGEAVRLALTFSDQARAQYSERLSETRRQEVSTLLRLGRTGVPVEFEGPLQQDPTGGWMVAGVPVLLPDEASQSSRVGSLVCVRGQVAQGRVRVQALHPQEPSGPAAGSKEPPSHRQGEEPSAVGRGEPTPAAAGKTPTPTVVSRADDASAEGATSTLTPTSWPTLAPSRPPVSTPGRGGRWPQDEPISPTPAGRGKASLPPPTSEGRGEERTPSMHPTIERRPSPAASNRPATPRANDASSEFPDGQTPAQRPSQTVTPDHAGRPDSIGSQGGAAEQRTPVGDIPVLPRQAHTARPAASRSPSGKASPSGERP